jgi:uncharacterized protein
LSRAMIDLKECDQGILVAVRAQPKARRNAIVGTHAGRLRIAVSDPPEKGKANRAIGEILAGALGVSPSRVMLVTGASSPNKTFLITGLSLQAVRELLAEQLS